MSDAVASINTHLAMSASTADASYSDILGLHNIDWTGAETKIVDTTVMDGTNPFERKTPTLINPGKVTGKLFFNLAEPTHLALRAALVGREKHYFKETGSDGLLMWKCQGYVTMLPVGASVDGVNEGTLTIELTELMTFS